MLNYRPGIFLFADYDLQEFLNNSKLNINAKIETLPKEQFLNSSDEELFQYFYSEMTIKPMTAYFDKMEMTQNETKLNMSDDPGYGDGATAIPGTMVQINIPFIGDYELLKATPSRRRPVFPRGRIVEYNPNGSWWYLQIFISKPYTAKTEEFKSDLDRNIDMIKYYLEGQELDINNYNNAIESLIKQSIKSRRERLVAHEGLSSLLGIPLVRKDGAPPIEPITVQKKITVSLPPIPKSGYKPEPGIKSDIFEDIIKIIRHEGRSMEATPKAFYKHDEEELRDILLAHLNGHFEGQAGGETFRKEGKTDILIKDGDRAAFVGECKVWEGPKALSNAIGQLLGYLTWRDCKAALIVFNKKISTFSSLLEKVPDTLIKHQFFVGESTQKPKDEAEWRFIFRSKEDEGRRVTIHIFLVNIYQKA